MGTNLTNYELYCDSTGHGVIMITLFEDYKRKYNVKAKMPMEAAYEGEYQAVIFGIKNIPALIGKEFLTSNDQLVVYSDSEYVIKQLSGDYKVKSEVVRPHYEFIMEWWKAALRDCHQIRFVWVKRDDNFAGRLLDDLDKNQPIVNVCGLGQDIDLEPQMLSTQDIKVETSNNPEQLIGAMNALDTMFEVPINVDLGIKALQKVAEAKGTSDISLGDMFEKYDELLKKKQNREKRK